jgi:hypothetical protein
MTGDTGLRRVNTSKTEVEAEPNVEYDIVVRARPVKHPLGQYVATHCYLALLDAGDKIVDTLSFDPSNSVGWHDAEPDNASCGTVVVEKRCEMSTWDDLAKAFKRYAGKNPYVLGHHNCCHAVMDALVSTNLRGAKQGIHFARTSNNTWHNANQNLGADDYLKKNL